MSGVSGRVALVTGAGDAKGIGFACAKALAAAGAKVAITSTTTRILERRDELGGDAIGVVADLVKSGDDSRLIAEVRKKLGPIDIVVNNAGMIQTGKRSRVARVEAITDAQWRDHLDLNLTTCFNVTRAVLPFMLRRGYGRIVNVSSITGPVTAIPKAAGYGAAKAAMIGFTRTVAIETARRGITANAIAPGWIRTGSSSAKGIAAGIQTPIGRSGTPDEVAALALFLASEEASYLTGQMIVIDGGLNLQEL